MPQFPRFSYFTPPFPRLNTPVPGQSAQTSLANQQMQRQFYTGPTQFKPINFPSQKH